MAKPSLKRGESGLANAASKPFRINGWAPDWQARRLNVHTYSGAPSSGSKTMMGLLGGIMVEKLGLGRMRGDYERAVAHAQTRVTSPLLRLDDEEMRDAAE